MERIGIAASRMAKGKLWTYNLFVVLISCLCSLMIFFICGFTILIALFMISLIFRHFLPPEFNNVWLSIAKICMLALSVVVALLNGAAIVKNIKLTKQRI